MCILPFAILFAGTTTMKHCLGSRLPSHTVLGFHCVFASLFFKYKFYKGMRIVFSLFSLLLISQFIVFSLLLFLSLSSSSSSSFLPTPLRQPFPLSLAPSPRILIPLYHPCLPHLRLIFRTQYSRTSPHEHLHPSFTLHLIDASSSLFFL